MSDTSRSCERMPRRRVAAESRIDPALLIAVTARATTSFNISATMVKV